MTGLWRPEPSPSLPPPLALQPQLQQQDLRHHGLHSTPLLSSPNKVREGGAHLFCLGPQKALKRLLKGTKKAQKRQKKRGLILYPDWTYPTFPPYGPVQTFAEVN